ncbi:MAG: hypothetical protein CSA65_00315 [Proteobacteria bacterium]|nr:MAG: hypothetical protein CSA65_00315 [Pseudomonadota bacterium]
MISQTSAAMGGKLVSALGLRRFAIPRVWLMSSATKSARQLSTRLGLGFVGKLLTLALAFTLSLAPTLGFFESTMACRFRIHPGVDVHLERLGVGFLKAVIEVSGSSSPC